MTATMLAHPARSAAPAVGHQGRPRGVRPGRGACAREKPRRALRRRPPSSPAPRSRREGLPPSVKLPDLPKAAGNGSHKAPTTAPTPLAAPTRIQPPPSPGPTEALPDGAPGADTARLSRPLSRRWHIAMVALLIAAVAAAVVFVAEALDPLIPGGDAGDHGWRGARRGARVLARLCKRGRARPSRRPDGRGPPRHSERLAAHRSEYCASTGASSRPTGRSPTRSTTWTRTADRSGGRPAATRRGAPGPGRSPAGSRSACAARTETRRSG